MAGGSGIIRARAGRAPADMRQVSPLAVPPVSREVTAAFMVTSAGQQTDPLEACPVLPA